MGYSPWGCKESDMTESLSMHTVLSTKFVAQFEIRKYNASGFAVLSQVCFGCQQQNYIKLKSFCIAK